MDENLPPRLAAWLSALGHDTIHVGQCALLGAGDGAVAELSAREGRIIVTQDADFERPIADKDRFPRHGAPWRSALPQPLRVCQQGVAQTERRLPAGSCFSLDTKDAGWKPALRRR